MPTSILASVAGSAASAGIGALLGGRGGGGDSLSNFSPTGIDAGGLSSRIDGFGNMQVAPDSARLAQVGGVSNTFGQQADALGALLPRVAPGISDLRSARLSKIENARRSSVGNLRDNLARRRVLGSSFAQDAITRADSEFAAQSERAAAESFLQEMEMTTQLMQQQFMARRGQFQTNLDEMNLEANIALTLAGKATEVLAKGAQVEAMLNAQSQQGAGRFFGQLASPIGNAVSKGISGFGGFGGGSAGDPMG